MSRLQPIFDAKYVGEDELGSAVQREGDVVAELPVRKSCPPRLQHLSRLMMAATTRSDSDRTPPAFRATRGSAVPRSDTRTLPDLATRLSYRPSCPTTSAAERPNRRLDERTEKPAIALPAVLGVDCQALVSVDRLHTDPFVHGALEDRDTIGRSEEPSKQAAVVQSKVSGTVSGHSLARITRSCR